MASTMASFESSNKVSEPKAAANDGQRHGLMQMHAHGVGCLWESFEQPSFDPERWQLGSAYSYKLDVVHLIRAGYKNAGKIVDGRDCS